MSVESVPQPLVVGRYVLEREIGSGGMGSVYFGRMVGPAGFSRVVAIKRLHPQYSKDSMFTAAMIDEARLAARVTHANVVQVLDVVVHGGELLLVMELLHGETLARLISLTGGPLPLDVAGKIALDALSGLHAAHEVRDESGSLLELVHRDVSPQNVIVGTDGVSRLIDFGVAKAIGRMQQTTDGRLKGKIGYFAPETIRGGEVDRRVDVYAAGVMFWEMLTGTHLFKGQNELQIMNAILTSSVVPPSHVAPEVPKEVDAVVMKALEREPDQRFRTAEDMADALDEALVPARSRRVGEWVRNTADQTLTKREQALSELAGTGITGFDELTKVPESGVIETPVIVHAEMESELPSTFPLIPTVDPISSGSQPTPRAEKATQPSPRHDEPVVGAATLRETPQARENAPTNLMLQAAEAVAAASLAVPTVPATPAAVVGVAPTEPAVVATRPSHPPEPLAFQKREAPIGPFAKTDQVRPHRGKSGQAWMLPVAITLAFALVLALVLLLSHRGHEVEQPNPTSPTGVTGLMPSTQISPEVPPGRSVEPLPPPTQEVQPPAPSTSITPRKRVPVSKPNCIPPYTLDSRGIRIYKPECVTSPSK